MSDRLRALERAAAWQAERRTLSWTEKVRLVEQVLPDLRAWREVRQRREGARDTEPPVQESRPER